MALLIIAVQLVQGLISARWSDSIKTVPVVSARAPYSQYSFEGKKLFAFWFNMWDLIEAHMASLLSVKSLSGRF